MHNKRGNLLFKMYVFIYLILGLPDSARGLLHCFVLPSAGRLMANFRVPLLTFPPPWSGECSSAALYLSGL